MKGHSLVCLAVVAGLGVAGGTAQAALLNLSVTYPLVTADFLTAEYDADGAQNGSAGLFSASAFTSNWTPTSGGSSQLILLGDLDVEVVVDPQTGAGLSGTLLMTGDIDGNNVAETLFSSSTLSQWGFGAEDKFEVVFIQESGTMAPVGAHVGVIIDARNLTEFSDPSFDADFGPSDGTKADVFVVPEPATLALCAAGAGLAGLRRRRR